MDALKILCRSTTLSRKQAQVSRPSTGEAQNPQLYGKNTKDESSADLRESRKRKRDENYLQEAADRELDFFNSREEKNGSPTQAEKSDRRRRTKADNGSRREQEDFYEDVQDLPEDECRRILKSHKIKITRIWPGRDEDKASMGSKQKKKQKKLEDAEPMNAKKKKRKLDVVPQPLNSFSHLRSRYGIDFDLARNIEEQGFKIPTEIQLGALPLMLKRKTRLSSTATNGSLRSADHGHAEDETEVDLLAVAPTGSGKTLAFLLPIVDAISRKGGSRQQSYKTILRTGPSAVIVAPTKELAAQITNEARKLSQRIGVNVALVRKGMRLIPTSNRAEQDDLAGHEGSSSSDSNNEAEPLGVERAHDEIPDVLVTTPLTLLNAIAAPKNGNNALKTVRHLILDEADVLLDQMFRSQTLKIWSACSNADLRVSLWSATMGSNIEDLAKTTLLQHRSKTRTPSTKPAQIIRLVVGLKDSAIPSVQHKLIYAASEAGKLLAMRQLLRPSRSTPTTIQPPFLVFTQTIPRAIALASELRYDIPPTAASTDGNGRSVDRLAVLHADLPDAARASIMARFRAAQIWVLITTDLLARGVDFRGANAVVNYDVPTSGAAYVHRAGRTGRAGRAGGVAVTLYAEEDVPALRSVVNIVRAAEAAAGAELTGASTVAAATAATGLGGKGGGGNDSHGVQDWLLNALPKVSKKEKQLLKKRGVEARRAKPDPKYAGHGRQLADKARMRISTKSGYERRVENQRRAAAAASRGQRTAGNDDGNT